MLKVIKRDGSVQAYDQSKIESAITRCMQSVGVENPNMVAIVVERVASHVYDGIAVEDIQDIVENELMSHGLNSVARKYIIYRYEHAKAREIKSKIDFIHSYAQASNAATGSQVDPNSNVTSKNIATLTGELPKRDFITVNRAMISDRLAKMYGPSAPNMYKFLLDNHFIYKNDETSMANYCASITMYPWLLDGLKPLGGCASAPTNLKSFCGGFINLVFTVSSMLAGATATPEFLMYMDYFIRKEYGDDYINKLDDVVDLSSKQRSLRKVITDCFEQVVYSLNQPTGARNYQAVFWNISYYDKFYFESIFGSFVFPDGSKPKWETLSELQKLFMSWFNEERKKEVLTFPVETMAMLTDGSEPKDKEWFDFATKMYAEGHSFFTYLSDSADSLSSCCRLRNEITDNEFSYTLGAGGVSTGSKSVLTINLNRVIQEGYKRCNGDWKIFLEEVIAFCHDAQLAYNENLKDLQACGMLPLFDAGYINIKRQYLTIGINGLVEAAEFLGIEISDNPSYSQFVEEVLSLIESYNKKYRTKDVMFNCEMIPAENVGVKHAKWDREDGYVVPRDCYNSYFYIVEDQSLTILDKLKLHGRKYIQHLTGGSALHMNLDEHLSQEQYKQILRIATKEGCNYLTFNIPNTICNDCGHIDKHHLSKCSNCGSENVDYLTRVIGYLKRVSNFSEARQQEASRRYYIKNDSTI